MSNPSFLDQLNLRPQEKRIIFVIIIVVFLVLNIVMVWPHFSDWSHIKQELKLTTDKVHSQAAEIDMDRDATNGYKRQLAKLERDQKGGVSQSTDGALALQRTVNVNASRFNINVPAATPGTTTSGTNDYFEEKTLRLSVQGNETNLVNFIFNVGSDSSMIRIREMHLSPLDAGRFQLKADMLLAANYEKRAVVAAPAGPAAKSAPKQAAPAAAPDSRKPVPAIPSAPPPVTRPHRTQT